MFPASHLQNLNYVALTFAQCLIQKNISIRIRKNDLSISCEYLRRHWYQKNWQRCDEEAHNDKKIKEKKFLENLHYRVRRERKKLITAERRPHFNARNIIHETICEEFLRRSFRGDITLFISLRKIHKPLN